MARLLSVVMAVFTYTFLQNVVVPVPEVATGPSGISYTVCDDFNPATASFEVTVQPKSGPGEASQPPLTASINSADKTGKVSLTGRIDPLLGVDFVQVQSSSMDSLCLQALVVDLTIIIDKKTEFREPTGSSAAPQQCEADGDKTLGCKMSPAFVCPGAIKTVLVSKHIIDADAEERTPMETGQPPVYDITQDMTDAASAITEGIAQGASDVLDQRKKARIGGKASRTFNNFRNFLKAVGPVLNSLGGLTSILTTFLTPNPFDELAKYMERQFDIVQKQIRQLRSDIENLERIVESQTNKIAMATALRSIRFSSRGYQRLTAALAKAKVCTQEDLLKQSEVTLFLEETMLQDLRNHLEDLLEVDFGGVLEADTGLLLPLMKAYCKKDPARVKRFMQHVSLYAYSGTMTLFAFLDLTCLKNGGQEYCPNLKREKRDWLKKLYRFTKKAGAYKEAAEDNIKGLGIEMQDGLDKLISDEVQKTPNPPPNSADPFPGLLTKVENHITDKLNDVNDWPHACIVKPHLDAGKMFIFGFAQISTHTYGTSYKPWALFSKATLQQKCYKTMIPESGYTKTNYEVFRSEILRLVDKNKGNEAFIEYSSSQQGYVLRPWQLNGVPPISRSGDRMLYFIFNPLNYQGSTGTQKVIGHMVPIDVYFMETSTMASGSLPDPTIGCWEAYHSSNPKVGWGFSYHCRAPAPSHPDRDESSEERFVAIVGN